MALEEKDEEVKAEAPPEKKKLPVKLIVIALVGVLVLGGAAAGYFLVLAPKMKGGHGKPAVEKVEKKHGEKGEEGEGGGAGQLKALEPFIVNLNDEQGSRYLKAVMQFEVSNSAVDKEITDKTPQIRDEILMLLSNKSYDDVATVSGKRILKREIIGSVNKFLKSGQVTQIYFSEFVVQ